MGEFDFKPAIRAGLKLRLALMGPGGSGKTLSALRLASGLAPGAPIAFIDSENKRALEYADRFKFQHMDFRAPYSPDRYLAAIAAGQRLVGDEGVIIVDSLSHGWIGKGGVLDIKAQSGADFSGWKKATPEQEKLMGAIMACPSHIICCLRVKVEYEMQEQVNRQGRTVSAPVKIGLAPVQRDGVDYEFSIVGSIDMAHQLTITKASFDIMDRTFDRPGPDLGARIRDWLDSSQLAPPDEPEARGTTVIAASPVPAPAAAQTSVPVPTAPPARSLSPDEIAARFHEEPPTEERPETVAPAPAAQRPALGTDRPPTRFQLKDIAVHAGEAGYTDDVAAHVHVDTICQELFGYKIFGADGQPSYSNIRSARDAAQIDARLKDEAKKAAAS
jgi:AAA domain